MNDLQAMIAAQEGTGPRRGDRFLPYQDTKGLWKHCPTCTCPGCEIGGELPTRRAMSQYHIILPCCGEVGVPEQVMHGICTLCREEAAKARKRLAKKGLSCVDQVA